MPPGLPLNATLERKGGHMKRNLEILGLSTEVLGLTFVLFAALWQGAVTDWLDRFPIKAQNYIQETANLAILRSINRVALAMNESDPIRRKELFAEAETISMETQFKLIEIRDQTSTVEKDQASWLTLVRKALFVIGATLIVVGKGLVLRYKSLAVSKP